MKKSNQIPFTASKAQKKRGGSKPAVVVGIVSVVVVIACLAGFRLTQVALPGSEFALTKADSVATEPASNDSDEPVSSEKTIFVHVEGEVANPGLLELPEGSRVFDAIQAAGDFTDDAKRDAVNLARILVDGEQIIVASSLAEDAAASPPGVSMSSGALSGKVNINTADVAALDSLPGIGESTAKRIIADREANGPFKSIEDLKRVSGIGDKKYAQLEGSITVG